MVNRENPISGTKSTQGSNGAGNRFHDCFHLQQSKQSRALTREIPAYSAGSSLLTDGKKKSGEGSGQHLVRHQRSATRLTTNG